MLRYFRPAAAVLAAFALPLLMQAAFAQSTSPTATKSMPPAVSPAVPARVANPVGPATLPAAAPYKRVDINGASESDLAALPGIGPATAKAIVAGRPWDDLGELVKKKALNKPTFDRNKAQLALANINTSPADEMAKTLPGIGDKTAPKIVAGRPYATPQDLVTKKVISSSQYDKIKNVVTY